MTAKLTCIRDSLRHDYRAARIENLCETLQERHAATTLLFFLERYGIFSAEHRSGVQPPSTLGGGFLRPLDDLVKSGAFRPPTLSNFRSHGRYGPKQKDILALKLAHCLAEFFLSGPATLRWDDKLIFASLGEYSNEPKLYMTFTVSDEEIPEDLTHKDLQIQMLALSEPARLSFAKLLVEIYGGRPIDLEHLATVPAQFAELFLRALEIQREGGGLYAEALKATLIFDVVSSKPRPGEDPIQAFRRTVRETIVGQLEKAVMQDKHRRSEAKASTDGSAARHRAESAIETQQPTLTPTSNGRSPTPIRRVNTASRQSTMMSQAAPAGSRVTIFRARQVTVREEKTVLEAVREILNANITGSDNLDFKFTIKEVTTLPNRHRSMRTPKRGSAIVYFRGNVPDELKKLFTKESISEVMCAGEDDELSMEVDAHFLGATQLHEPPPDIPVQAE